MRELIKLGDPRLSTVCREVSTVEIRNGVFLPLIEDMHQHLIEDSGIGIAAPQLGETIRLAAFEDTLERMAHLTPERTMELNRHAHPFFVLYNPSFDPASNEITYYFEGCLSFPGQVAVVERWKDIRFRGYKPNGERYYSSTSGWLARCMQHEIDHLDGVSFLDRALEKSIMSVEEYIANWKDKTSEELQKAFE